MDLAQLNAFVTVAQAGSFSLAGDTLFVTQPAVSKRVAALEAALGNPLFDRIGRQVTLTEAGRALLPHALRILQEAEDGRRAIANLSQEVSGRLSIASSHHIGLHRLPAVLRTYVRRYPRVQLDLHFMESEEACQAVEHGQLELGLITLPPGERASLEMLAVWEDPLVVVTAADHPLGRTPPTRLAELAGWPAILPDSSTYTRALVEAVFHQHRLPLIASQTTNFLETIKMLVAVGLGWSLLPQGMVGEGLIAHLIADLELTRRLGITRHTRRTLSNAARAFWTLLGEEAAEMNDAHLDKDVGSSR